MILLNNTRILKHVQRDYKHTVGFWYRTDSIMAEHSPQESGGRSIKNEASDVCQCFVSSSVLYIASWVTGKTSILQKTIALIFKWSPLEQVE